MTACMSPGDPADEAGPRVTSAVRSDGSREGGVHGRLRVALAQVDAVPGEYGENLSKMKRIIDGCRGATDLVVFPEYFLSGYLRGHDVYDKSLRMDGEVFQEILRSSDGVTLAVSFIEESDDFHFYNSLAFVSNGRVLGVHRKIYLVNYGLFDERRHFSAGSNHRCGYVNGFRVAPFVCADAWNPALVHLSALEGAHLILISACSPSNGLVTRLSSSESWYRLNRFYATMYGAYVVFVNRTGWDDDLEFWGGSEVVNPFGEVVTSPVGNAETVLYAELCLSDVREARTILHTVRDEDMGLIQRRVDAIVDAKSREQTATPVPFPVERGLSA